PGLPEGRDHVRTGAADRGQEAAARAGDRDEPLTQHRTEAEGVGAALADSPPPHRPVLVVDFGAQYAQLIARRVRECRVFSEIVPSSMPLADMLAKRPKAIILSGGPSSVYADGAPQVDVALFEAGVPTFGICYGFQAMARALCGGVRRAGTSE